MKKMTAVILLAGVCLLTGCASNQIDKGTELLEEGSYQEALDIFQQAAEDGKSEEAEAYRGIGMAEYELEDYAAALEAFQKVLDCGGEETETMYNLMGICAMKQSDYQGALNYFEKGIILWEASADEKEQEKIDDSLRQEMMFNQVVCYEKQQDWENAKTKIEEYISAYPNDAKAQKEAQFLSTR